MSSLSIIISTNTVCDGVDAFLRSLRDVTFGHEVEVVLVDLAEEDRRREIEAVWQGRVLGHLQYAHCSTGNVADSFNMGLGIASAKWVMFHSSPLALTPQLLSRVAELLLCEGASALLFVTRQGRVRVGDRLVSCDELELDLQDWVSVVLQRDLLSASNLRLDGLVRPGFAATALVARYLLANHRNPIGVIEVFGESASMVVKDREPSALTWSNARAYEDFLVHGCLQLLEEASRECGKVPRWLQQTVLMELQRYFSADMRERSPTALVNDEMANRFHEIVGETAQHIDVDSIAWLAGRGVSNEVMHALLSYKSPQCWSPPCVGAFDHDQGLLRLTYYLHGRNPAESFWLGEDEVEPAYAKYRACNFFRRQLFRQRIVWIPVDGAHTLSARLDGEVVPITLLEEVFLPSPEFRKAVPCEIVIDDVRSVFPGGRGTQGKILLAAAVLKMWVLRLLSWLPPIRGKFGGAWIFSDRITDADDNAEHMYRWVTRHRSEINAWFLLDRTSPDWERLEREGFRLLSAGWLRKLAVLNCEHIISSHMDLIDGGFDPKIYGSLFRWRFTFLQHGVIKDDLSHWLSGKPIDIFVTTSPAEYASIVCDDTPYTYTDREVRLTGLPRHDALLKNSADYPPVQADLLFVMPTWRSALSNVSPHSARDQSPSAAVRGSVYVQRWRSFLADERLRRLADQHAKQVVFMPHPNAVPYLDAFDLPSHVRVVTRADIGMQELFCRTAIMITDFSSVAFEAAYLHRPVVYYQFDRDQFYGGAHNWREGYFNCERDGFGPVVDDGERLIEVLEKMLDNNCEPGIEYLRRMKETFPRRDGLACERVFEAIRSCKKPYTGLRSQSQRVG